MSSQALRTIKDYNLKWSLEQCKAHADEFIQTITKKYPQGLEDDRTYFVMPNFEHVERRQPIAIFDPTEGLWVLDINTKFIV